MDNEVYKPLIYSAGVGRTGTTYLSQVLRYLSHRSCIRYMGFQGGHHKFSPPSPEAYGLISVRDLRDVIISRWRITLSLEGRYEESLVRQMTPEEVYRELGKNDLEHSGTLIQQVTDTNESFDRFYDPSQPMLFFIKFEDFTTDIEFLFSFLGDKFNIEIGKEEKKYIKKTFSKEENQKRSESQESFATYEANGIHGHHIFKGESQKWNTYIPPNLLPEILKTFKNSLLKWGYKI